MPIVFDFDCINPNMCASIDKFEQQLDERNDAYSLVQSLSQNKQCYQ